MGWLCDLFSALGVTAPLPYFPGGLAIACACSFSHTQAQRWPDQNNEGYPSCMARCYRFSRGTPRSFQHLAGLALPERLSA